MEYAGRNLHRAGVCRNVCGGRECRQVGLEMQRTKEEVGGEGDVKIGEGWQVGVGQCPALCMMCSCGVPPSQLSDIYKARESRRLMIC